MVAPEDKPRTILPMDAFARKITLALVGISLKLGRKDWAYRILKKHL